MQSLISSRGKISTAARSALASLSAREFFHGDLEIDGGPMGAFGLHKSLQYPIALTHLATADCRIGYRRGIQHIRGNPVGFRIIWFVRKGSLQVARSIGTHTVKAGQAAFIDSNVPFHVKTMGNEFGEYESLQLLVPGYLFLTYLQEADRLAAALDLSGPEASAINDILDLLARSGDAISRSLATNLAHGLLASIADQFEHQRLKVSRQERLSAERLADISNYILANLDASDLTLEKVVAHIGFSSRYLCYIFEANRTTFSEVLWNGRLEKAHRMLRETPQDVAIQDIAHSCGFKSSAHFSRLFKATFEMTPSRFRALQQMPAGARDQSIPG